MADPPRASHAADRLLDAIERKRSPACVGIDPVVERMPRSVLAMAQKLPQPELGALILYCGALIQAIEPHVPIVKFQSACFERYRGAGFEALFALIRSMRENDDIEIILDGKRGDIGLTSDHYAASAFDPIASDDGVASLTAADWLTVNPYLGEDSLTPFLRTGSGAFALVRTSNPGGDEIQSLSLGDGRTVFLAVGQMIARIGSRHTGGRGFSSLGAVVGATKPADARQLRQIMPQQIFLVPGFGAQGAGIDDVLPCFNSDGSGAIVTASRSVIYSFEPNDPKWTLSVADAAAKFADEVGRAVGMRG